MSLNWKGDALLRKMRRTAAAAGQEIGLRIEGAAKQQLVKGRGVLTGTLRRSITAQPVEVFRDIVAVTVATDAETVMAEGSKKQKIVAAGTKLRYAMIVHRRIPYMTDGLKRVKPQVIKVWKKHLESDHG